ncbi:hypothetical protein [Herbiconiux daphne]|uniref:Uncharacterized protein n=1 Tax=Herbiconiux daphne TaxID=2970914 RepID=A0ABT2H0N6_9MICO|nr:hypothetical protein [Herbiconiux daphne]MCS5733498.1 hypothetical protein [Herbiconiux daphne]
MTRHRRLEVIASGQQGVLIGHTADGYVSVILDGLDEVSEFTPEELVIWAPQLP